MASDILIIGGGIGGLAAAIALGQRGNRVTVIERDPDWAVYGVGITQQANVVRAVTELGISAEYMAAGFRFDAVEIYAPDGTRLARVPSPRLAEGYPPNLGMGRRALQKVLAERAKVVGAEVRLGVTASAIEDRGDRVEVAFSDGSQGIYAFVVGADGAYSQTRAMLFPEAGQPEFTGQGVWRYNFPRDPMVDCLSTFNGPTGVGLVPMSDTVMYMYVTTPEPDNPRYPLGALAAAMRAKIAHCAPMIRDLAASITDNSGVVYRPLEALLVRGSWHKGRVVLLGDAVHATTPHLGQGGGMAIEDAVVLGEEIARHADPEAAFAAYRLRRFQRCEYIVSASLAICYGQIGKGPPVDMSVATREMFELTAQPI